jgi:hypothetical protein
MKCIMCKNGDLQEGTTTVTLERDATIVVFIGGGPNADDTEEK